MIEAQKFSPIELLSKLENSNSSGCLEIYQQSVCWKIYLQQGYLKYVFCSAQSLEQLKYYLHYVGWKQIAAVLKQLPPSCVKMQLQSNTQQQSSESNLYSETIAWLIEEQHLTRDRALKLIELITKDALQSCLWLNSGTSVWYDGQSIPLWIEKQLKNPLSLRFSLCWNIEQNRLKKWQPCSDRLLSVHQRPYLTVGWEQKSLPASGSLNHRSLKELNQVVRGHTSIRQLSILLQKDELQVAKILSPYIDEQIILLSSPQPPLNKLPNIPRTDRTVGNSPHLSRITDNKTSEFLKTNSSVKTKKIVCIDDSPTILNEMRRYLNLQSFEVTTIDDPVQAVSTGFRVLPDLILLDITMPKINGYKLCTLLRNSGNCSLTPIIMVTGNTSLIDRSKAKIAGARDYLTKPFTREELTRLVSKYL